MTNNSLVPQAVCVLILRQTDTGVQVLCASRKDKLNDFGLPGGKVDPGESLKHAAIREFREETDIYLGYGTALSLTPVYPSMCWDLINVRGYLCTTFIYTGEFRHLLPMELSELSDLEGYQPRGEGKLAWKTPRFLEKHGTFKDYNRRLFLHMGLVQSSFSQVFS